eukprot:COSAG01_NODE_1454_length_10256_cov_4.300748_4_plen_440_part_00
MMRPASLPLLLLLPLLLAASPTAIASRGAGGSGPPPPHPGHVVGYDTLFSRRLGKWYYQRHLDRSVVWDKPKQTDKIFWWKYTGMDCGYDDIEMACAGESVAKCEQKCALDPLCGGFNYPHGIMKKLDCTSKRASSSVDLYIKSDHAQPPPPPPASNFPPIWPYPKSFTSGKANASVVGGETFKFSSSCTSKDLTAAFGRYKALTFPHATAAGPGGANSTAAAAAAAGLSGVTVTVADPSPILQLETDESYTLHVPLMGSITISAKTVFGAMYGLETLSQLVTFDFDKQAYYIPWAPWTIDDAPRFQHREVLVDTARHFEPVETLKRLITSFTYSKVNTVHWHLVDSQSFPFDSKRRPLLAQKGAYSAQERYSPLDVAEVVEFGRSHGVRMMVEVDGPGHAQWCALALSSHALFVYRVARASVMAVAHCCCDQLVQGLP